MKRSTNRARVRLAESLGLILVAVVVVAEGVRVATAPENQKTYGAAEGGMYLVLLGALLAGMTLVQGFRSPQSEAGRTVEWGRGLPRVVMVFAILAGYVLLIGYLGYLLAVALFFVVFLRVFSPYRWIPILIASFAMAIGSAYAWSALSIMLPTGILPWP